MNRRLTIGAATLLAALLGCRSEMYDQPKYKPYKESTLFDDGSSERPLPPGVIAVEEPRTALQGMAALERGRERYNIYCSPCHDYTGSGNGMVVQRGYPPPPTFHQDRLRSADDKHFLDVMSNGFGAMPSYASQIPPADRDTIVLYIRALQLSRHMPEERLSDADRTRLAEVP